MKNKKFSPEHECHNSHLLIYLLKCVGVFGEEMEWFKIGSETPLFFNLSKSCVHYSTDRDRIHFQGYHQYNWENTVKVLLVEQRKGYSFILDETD